MKRYHIIVHGNVQGVGFRAYVQQKALEYSMKGWVKNKRDESVEIDVEGPANKMDEFLSEIEKGSPFSKVDSLDVTELYELKIYSSFKIKY
ncbi:acylphosphatase [Bacillus tianshenii]|nr:acylphosphatase [Bacillus tianshenii]